MQWGTIALRPYYPGLPTNKLASVFTNPCGSARKSSKRILPPSNVKIYLCERQWVKLVSLKKKNKRRIKFDALFNCKCRFKFVKSHRLRVKLCADDNLFRSHTFGRRQHYLSAVVRSLNFGSRLFRETAFSDFSRWSVQLIVNYCVHVNMHLNRGTARRNTKAGFFGVRLT